LHLSALMCPRHRSAVLRLIRRKLHRREPCRVVSTQVIEAGVDVDFPVVYRAMAGLDSVAQAAGRCNREGRLSTGQFFVFETDDVGTHEVKLAAQASRVAAVSHEDLLSIPAVQDFFRELYWKRGDEWDRHRIMHQESLDLTKDGLVAQFRDIAERYRLIREEQVPVLVPYGLRGRALVAELEEMNEAPGRWFDRRAQAYSVGVYRQQLEGLLVSGIVARYHHRFHVLADDSAYHPLLGLRMDRARDPSGLLG
jgi:hypothetical protein